MAKNSSPRSPVTVNIQKAEDIFVALAQTPEFMYYLGRFSDANEEELRSVFGLALAAMRRSGSATPLGRDPDRRITDSTISTLTRADLETRLREMLAAIAQRDAEIRELTSRLKKTNKAS